MPEQKYKSRYENPKVACAICNGTGRVLTERPDGAPRAWIQCTYCKGRGNALWVVERKERIWGPVAPGQGGTDRLHHFHVLPELARRVRCLTRVTANLGLEHALCWLALLVGWVTYWTSSHKQWSADGGTTYVQAPPRHAPGFTDDRERAALTILGAGIAAKGKWDHHERQQHQQLNRIEATQRQIQQEYRFKNNGPQ